MSILTFAAVIDFTIALENDGIVHSVMAFYFVSGEPYLKSGHGSGINYHDGIIHFACYIIILLAIDNRFVECVLSSRNFFYIVNFIRKINILDQHQILVSVFLSVPVSMIVTDSYLKFLLIRSNNFCPFLLCGSYR